MRFANYTRGNKYHNVKTVMHGIVFDSQIEANRYFDLLMLQKAGSIQDLQRQVPFVICPKVPGVKGSKDRKYIADFVYLENGKKVIEDVKSSITKMNATYRLKKQLVQFQYPEYEFREYQ